MVISPLSSFAIKERGTRHAHDLSGGWLDVDAVNAVSIHMLCAWGQVTNGYVHRASMCKQPHYAKHAK